MDRAGSRSYAEPSRKTALAADGCNIPVGMQEPPRYARYPRPTRSGEAKGLRALLDGYFALTPLFIINFALGLVIYMAFVRVVWKFDYAFTWIAYFGCQTLLSYVLSIKYTRRIGQGMYWKPITPHLWSIGIGLTNGLCFFGLGYVVLQNISARILRLLGMPSNFFGLKKREAYAALNDMEIGDAARRLPGYDRIN